MAKKTRVLVGFRFRTNIGWYEQWQRMSGPEPLKLHKELSLMLKNEGEYVLVIENPGGDQAITKSSQPISV